MEYLDFELSIELGEADTYELAVLYSPEGEARGTLRLPFDELALENRMLQLKNALLRSGTRRRQVLAPEQQAVADFGAELFEALFQEDIYALYVASLNRAIREDKGLRLKLRIQPPELATLPWEFLYDPGQREYLCLSSQTPLVRTVEMGRAVRPLTISPPLRILGLIASPANLPPLDVDGERQRMDEALASLQARGLVEVEWLPGQTWRDLQRATRRGPWHVFHFIGHGGFDRAADEGLIALADDRGQYAPLMASQLARLLADHSPLRLVFLNACEGAAAGSEDIFSSTAGILVRRGIPAVVAMQYEITDQAALEFSRAFYEAVADGLPVDTAVTEARKAVSLAQGKTVEWGTPVLTMRAPDGILFTVEAGAVPPAQQQAQPETPVTPPGSDRPLTAEQAELSDRALDLTHERQFDEALALLGEAIEAEPGLAWLYYLRGHTYHQAMYFGHPLGSYDRAIADQTRAIRLAPDAFYYSNRGATFDAAGNYEAAIADKSRAIELDPDNAEYYHGRAVSYHNGAFYGHPSGSYEKALEDYAQAIRLDPANALSYWERGKTRSEMGDHEGGLRDLDSAIKLQPDNADFYYSRGQVLAAMKEQERALEDFTQAVELAPGNPLFHDVQSIMLHNLDRYEEAIAATTRAIELDPGNGEYYYSRGLSRRSAGDRSGARQDFEQAVALGYTQAAEALEKLVDPRVEELRGLVSSASWDEAITLAEAILEAQPDDPDVLKLAAKAYQTRGSRRISGGETQEGTLDIQRALALEKQAAGRQG